MTRMSIAAVLNQGSMEELSSLKKKKDLNEKREIKSLHTVFI